MALYSQPGIEDKHVKDFINAGASKALVDAQFGPGSYDRVKGSADPYLGTGTKAAAGSAGLKYSDPGENDVHVKNFLNAGATQGIIDRQFGPGTYARVKGPSSLIIKEKAPAKPKPTLSTEQQTALAIGLLKPYTDAAGNVDIGKAIAAGVKGPVIQQAFDTDTALAYGVMNNFRDKDGKYDVEGAEARGVDPKIISRVVGEHAYTGWKTDQMAQEASRSLAMKEAAIFKDTHTLNPLDNQWYSNEALKDYTANGAVNWQAVKKDQAFKNILILSNAVGLQDAISQWESRPSLRTYEKQALIDAKKMSQDPVTGAMFDQYWYKPITDAKLLTKQEALKLFETGGEAAVLSGINSKVLSQTTQRNLDQAKEQAAWNKLEQTFLNDLSFQDVSNRVRAVMTDEQAKAYHVQSTRNFTDKAEAIDAYKHFTPEQQAQLLNDVNAKLNYDAIDDFLNIVPVVSTIKNWDTMSTPWKAVSVVTDALVLAPMVKAVATPIKGAALARAGTAGESILAGDRVTNLIKSEVNASKDMVAAMKQAKISDDIIDAYKDLSDAQVKYINALDDLRVTESAGEAIGHKYGSTTVYQVSLEQARTNEVLQGIELQTKAKRYASLIGQSQFTEPSAHSAMYGKSALDDYAQSVARITRNQYQHIIEPKASYDVEGLKADLAKVQTKIDESIAKHEQTDKRLGFLSDKADIERQIAQAQMGEAGLTGSVNDLVKLRDNLVLLQKAEELGYSKIEAGKGFAYNKTAEIPTLKQKIAEIQKTVKSDLDTWAQIYPDDTMGVKGNKPLQLEPMPTGGGGVSVFELNKPASEQTAFINAMSDRMAHLTKWEVAKGKRAPIYIEPYDPATGTPKAIPINPQKPELPSIFITEPSLQVTAPTKEPLRIIPKIPSKPGKPWEEAPEWFEEPIWEIRKPEWKIEEPWPLVPVNPGVYFTEAPKVLGSNLQPKVSGSLETVPVEKYLEDTGLNPSTLTREQIEAFKDVATRQAFALLVNAGTESALAQITSAANQLENETGTVTQAALNDAIATQVMPQLRAETKADLKALLNSAINPDVKAGLEGNIDTLEGLTLKASIQQAYASMTKTSGEKGGEDSGKPGGAPAGDRAEIILLEGVPRNPGETIWKQGVTWIEAQPPSPDSIKRGDRGRVLVTGTAPSDAPRTTGTPQQTLYTRGNAPDLMKVRVGFEVARVKRGRSINFTRDPMYLTRKGGRIIAHNVGALISRRRIRR